ncbi:FecR domain-containing protein [Sphingomonas panacis]|uniref:FecR family protein n=1 Tax=Sphingomonas panacis TaxID=1560345 RepID=UPI0009F352D1
MAASLDRYEQKLTDEARRWVVRLTSGGMTEFEMSRFRNWVADCDHERVLRREMTAWRKLGQLGDFLESTICLPSPVELARKRVRRWRVSGLAVAAGLAVILATPSLLLHARADQIAHASIERLTLPDGSSVVLDAGAAIAVRYAESERKVELLRGRAWFEVKHDKNLPFRVSARPCARRPAARSTAVKSASMTVCRSS